MTIRNLEAYFKPRRVVLVGEPVGSTAQQLIAKLRHAAAPGLLAESMQELNGKEPGVLGVVGDPGVLDPDALARLAALGCRALIWPHERAPPAVLLQAARIHTTRLLGPRSPGILQPRGGLAATLSPGRLPHAAGGAMTTARRPSTGPSYRAPTDKRLCEARRTLNPSRASLEER